MVNTHSRYKAIVYSIVFTVVIVSLSVHMTAYLFEHAAISGMNLIAFSMGMALIVAPPSSYLMALYSVKLIELQEELAELAITDDLTGALNRRSILYHLKTEQQRMARSHAPAAIMLIDIDRLSAINAQHGRSAGDAVLRHFTRSMQKLLRAGTDNLARLEGDKFLCLLAETTLGQAKSVGERMRVATETSVTPFRDKDIKASICIGITYITPTETALDAIERADKCLERAKQAGDRSKLVTCTPVHRQARSA